MQTSKLHTYSQINTKSVKSGIISNLRRLDMRFWASPIKTQEHKKEASLRSAWACAWPQGNRSLLWTPGQENLYWQKIFVIRIFKKFLFWSLIKNTVQCTYLLIYLNIDLKRRMCYVSQWTTWKVTGWKEETVYRSRHAVVAQGLCARRWETSRPWPNLTQALQSSFSTWPLLLGFCAHLCIVQFQQDSC